ncbi:hypothetical protein B296_00055646, partial [Ensete ventricosum]
MVTLDILDTGLAPRDLTPQSGHRSCSRLPRPLPVASNGASHRLNPSLRRRHLVRRRTRARDPRAKDGQRNGSRQRRRRREVRRPELPGGEEGIVFLVVDGEVKKPSPLQGGDKIRGLHLQQSLTLEEEEEVDGESTKYERVLSAVYNSPAFHDSRYDEMMPQGNDDHGRPLRRLNPSWPKIVTCESYGARG